ncbi:MAG TPA: ABC transporter ATP-binding protein [Candidatus Blautia avistercoris]|uniref:ABC transporter ATP-binding protein n=1 Tax=Blautia sp. An249 TaxID=1965603 RepID=UPI000B3704F5|nr:ABC transporter ATP-binding protein [Blautia sp. An249]OUO75955.1 ABC transporter ATP-binding protein [Blautia sp. An249]HIY18049.1 ABC transporter ATP-binding protein [Candidatus Blautia avistercoris]
MLKVENLKKQYGSFTLDCSLEVMPGCITGLVGRNGAGKSTTFKAILGLISTDSGSISIFGKDIKDFTETDKQKIGVVLSNSGFSGYLTINDILPILASLYPLFDQAAFLEYCNRFQLPLDKKIQKFSTGMKAKLKLIAAITHDASLLLLDEPTAGLDVVARDELLTLLRDFMEEKEDRAVLISSHISTDLESLCDDLYLIGNGKILLHEDTDRLLSQYAILKVDNRQFQKLDPRYLLKWKQEAYGYRCLTDQKQFYLENYPDIVVEKSGIDDLILFNKEVSL